MSSVMHSGTTSNRVLPIAGNTLRGSWVSMKVVSATAPVDNDQ